MEQAIIELLEMHAEDTDDLELKSRIEERIETVNDQSERIKKRVEELDDDVATAKTGLASVIKGMEEYPPGYEKGRPIKDVIIEYSIQYFEQATFKAILIAANECKDEKTAELCEEFIGDEREIAEILDQTLSGVVMDYINKETIEKTDIDYTGEEEGEL